MFSGMIDEAKAAVQELLARVATRAAIGVVFMIAIGFAIAALTMQLVDRFGGVTASWIIAAGFAVLGLVGLAISNLRESRQEERKLEEEAQADAASPSMAGATSKVAMQLPLALVGSLLTTTSGFISPLTVLRFLARNAALLAFGSMLAVLLWPQGTPDEESVVPSAEPAE